MWSLARVARSFLPRFIVLLPLPLLLMQGCAGLKPTPEQAQSTEFVIQGRFSVQYGEEQMSGLLHWQADGARDELLLSSQLGQGLARITRNARGVTLARSGEADIVADDVEKLTQATLGFGLPLGGLRYWVQGKTEPAAPSAGAAIAAYENGLLKQLRQDGWTIDYLQYREARPRKIHVWRDTLQIRLVIDEWQP